MCTYCSVGYIKFLVVSYCYVFQFYIQQIAILAAIMCSNFVYSVLNLIYV